MALLVRLVRSVFKLIFSLSAMLMHLLLPHLLSVVFAFLRLSFRLMSTSLLATIHGPRLYIDRLASDWTRQLITTGVSRDHLDQLYTLCRFFAASLIVLGWVVTALFIVAILRVVFGIFI